MIGLSLDYDIFIISSIYDLRHEGYSTEGAIMKAMSTESNTITVAGLIMTVAFSSLLLSSTDVLNQWGFMLVSTSLIDTFIVRTLLVPALMFCAVEWNWWPGKMPSPTKTLNRTLTSHAALVDPLPSHALPSAALTLHANVN
uniref:Membrane transport protein MMPL domain-containing protein n=1 Tax=Haptolina brevifila TaxID=156173 RepID=A0A7S2DNU0_9EUKA|mmetsp:Transcript_41314/g.82764  ORF Transcript_41314/g.82764 Transcript_41314/m.82764 type:complete len:142 (+) Transcript_41314:64-489(+)